MARLEELEVWKRVVRLGADLNKTFAELKDFRFRDQITRTALLILSKIAKGHERMACWMNSGKLIAISFPENLA